MNLTNINIYAEAYYSGNSHEENITIKTTTIYTAHISKKPLTLFCIN